jgi:uncharacterized membrane protein YgdD (TMEM256/DUF423 family)
MTNHTLQKNLIQAGAVFAAASVALGALGAHQLKDHISEASLNAFETGVRYQFYHALALIIIGNMMRRLNEKTAKRVAYLFLLGIFLFSGSLYILSIYKIASISSNYVLWVTGLTPIGGICFVAGWLLLAYNGYKTNSGVSSSGSSNSHTHRHRTSSQEK